MGVLLAGGHDPELAAERARELAGVDEVGDVRSAFGLFELRDVLDHAGFAGDGFELLERIEAWGFEVEVNEHHTPASFEEECSGVGEGQ